jgi:hypothetical protein
MSYKLPSQYLKAGAPIVTDDNTKGYVLGSVLIDTSVAPRVAYYCTNPATGAATWIRSGGTSPSHPSLSTLGWSASGHTGPVGDPSVAAFDAAAGAAQTVPATADGQILQRIGGVLVFATIAAGVVVGGGSDTSYPVQYVFQGTTTTVATGASTGPRGTL